MASNSDSTNDGPSPAKVPKHQKQLYWQVFLDKYSVTYPCIKKYSYKESGELITDQFRAYCTICDTNFSIKHGGIRDCNRHVDGPTHQENIAKRKSNRSIKSFIQPAKVTALKYSL